MADDSLSANGNADRDYNSLIMDSEDKSGIRITRTAATQLTKLELREIEHLREIAIDRIRTAVGDRGFTFTFEHEMDLWPEGKTPSDKMVFRCFSDGELIGYALVVRGWPEKTQWTVQHMIVHPDHRNQGFGTHMMQGIEDDALKHTESIDTINALPLHVVNEFYGYLGYEQNVDLTIPVKGIGERKFKAFSKKIR